MKKSDQDRFFLRIIATDIVRKPKANDAPITDEKGNSGTPGIDVVEVSDVEPVEVVVVFDSVVELVVRVV